MKARQKRDLGVLLFIEKMRMVYRATENLKILGIEMDTSRDS